MKVTALLVLALAIVVPATAQQADKFTTPAGELTITFVGHGTLMLQLGSTVVHVDPVSRYADYAKMPKADLILICHEHGDHLDPAAIAKIRTAQTEIVASANAAAKIEGARAIKPGDTATLKGIGIEAVAAYNITQARLQYHPKSRGDVGYVLTAGGKRLYIAGDTEDIPEARALKGIDIAFLPMNLPYTMTPEQVADLARAIRPRVLYPYHYGETDPAKLVALLAGEKDIEVRVRALQ